MSIGGCMCTGACGGVVSRCPNLNPGAYLGAPPIQQMSTWGQQMQSIGGLSGMMEDPKLAPWPTAHEIATEMLSMASIDNVRTALLVQLFEELNSRTSAARRVSDRILSERGQNPRASAREVLEAVNLITGIRELPVNDEDKPRSRL